MGGGFKALLDLGGKPLLQHVIDRLAGQVSHSILSVETVAVEFEPFGLVQVPDPEPGSNGPLGGLAAALDCLEDSETKWLLLVPCDAPFLPPDLAHDLLQKAESEHTEVAVASYDSELQPTFSLWHQDMRSALQQAVNKDRMAGFKQFLRGRSYSVVDWPVSSINPFFNINEPSALEVARKMVSEQTGSKP